MHQIESSSEKNPVIPTEKALAAKHTQRHRIGLFQAYLIIAVLAFMALAIVAKTVAYFTFDVTITRAVQSFHNEGFNFVTAALNWAGFAPQTWMISVAVLALLLICRLRWETLVATVSLIGISALGLSIKILVERPRPSADLVKVVNQLHDYSFPSGHVLFFTTFGGFLLFLAYTLLKRSWWRTLLLIILGGMIVLIGPARIYAGQHWASDVTGAYLLGSLWLSLSILVYRWGKPRFFVKPDGPSQPDAGPRRPRPNF